MESRQESKEERDVVPKYRLGVEVPLLIRLLFAIEQLKEFGSNLTHFVPILCSAVGEEQRELVTANETVSVSVEQGECLVCNRCWVAPLL